MPNFQALKIPRKHVHNKKNKLETERLYLLLGFTGSTTNLHIVLNTPKNPLHTLLWIVTQKNNCQIFPAKRILETKISSPKKSFSHSCDLKSKVSPGEL